MKQYKFYTYDIWGNKYDGFEVNDVFSQDLIVEMQEDWSEIQVFCALKAHGLFYQLHFKSFEIDWSDENVIYITDIRQSAGGYKPLCEFRLIQEVIN